MNLSDSLAVTGEAATFVGPLEEAALEVEHLLETRLAHGIDDGSATVPHRAVGDDEGVR
jgi:hypothetical protein